MVTCVARVWPFVLVSLVMVSNNYVSVRIWLGLDFFF